MTTTALSPRTLSHTTETPAHPTRVLAFEVEGAIRLFEFTAELVRVGRSHSADLSLDDRSVSRRHALLLTRPDGRVEIIDDTSLFGTYVNGEEIRRQTLHHGDVVRVGETVFSFLDVPARWTG